MSIKLVFISDTHNKHDRFEIPDGDIVIHCGDVSGMGRKNEILNFADWFSELPHKHKIMIPGNHDFLFEKEYGVAANITESRGIICLIDNFAEVEGIKFWGSPITPWFYNWAFNRFRGSSIEHHWNKIPDGIDVLLTHGPPSYVNPLSVVKNDNEDVGCEDLYKAIMRIKPKINAFGHIHEGYGYKYHEDVLFLNCSLLDENYYPKNSPIEIKYDGGQFSFY